PAFLLMLGFCTARTACRGVVGSVGGLLAQSAASCKCAGFPTRRFRGRNRDVKPGAGHSSLSRRAWSGRFGASPRKLSCTGGVSRLTRFGHGGKLLAPGR